MKHYYSNRPQNQQSQFDSADIFYASKLLNVNLEEFGKIVKKTTEISEKRFSQFLELKTLSFVFKDKVYFFEDETIITETSLKAEALCYIYMVKKFAKNDKNVLLNVLNNFFSFYSARIEKLKELKKLRDEAMIISSKIKGIERSLFSFDLPNIPEGLEIKETETEVFISKVIFLNGINIKVKATFTKELFLKNVALQYNNTLLPLKVNQEDRERLLFSSSFYEEVSDFLELKEYNLQELSQTIKTAEFVLTST